MFSQLQHQKTLAGMPGQRSPSPGANQLILVHIYSASLEHDLPRQEARGPTQKDGASVDLSLRNLKYVDA